MDTLLRAVAGLSVIGTGMLALIGLFTVLRWIG